MRQRKLVTLFTLLLTLLLVSWGCSGSGGGGIVIPEAKSPLGATQSGTGAWGLYQVSVNLNTKAVDIIQLRQADYIINVLGFMEPPALVNMNIDFETLVVDWDNNYIGADVQLTHPIPDPVFMGFDVRGICFGPDITNADGYTIMMNPADFDGIPFGYLDGMLGAPNSYANYDGLWGYKYFCDGLGLDDDLGTFFTDPDNLANRGVFSDAETNSRHYDLSWANTTSPIDFLVFNYAIYANYNWPVGDPPFDIDSFQITAANSQEAFCGSFTEVTNTLNYYDGSGSGTISLDIEVWDWQGLDSSEVTIESVLGSLAVTVPDSEETGTAYSNIYHFVNLAPTVTSTADIDFLVTVTDEKTFGESWFFNLLPDTHDLYAEQVYNCFMYYAEVTNLPIAEPPDPVGDLSLSTGRTSLQPCDEVTQVQITWADPGDPDIEEYGIYVDTTPYTGLDDNFELLGTSLATSYNHNASSLVPLNGNAAYSYSVRSRSIATGGAPSPGSEAGDSQLAFIELDSFTGGTAAGGGTWTSQSDDGIVLWTDLSSGSFLINNESFGRNTTWNLAGGSEAATEWTMLTSPEIPDVPDANRAIMELNHDQRGSNFSSWASRGIGTYSVVPTSGTNAHTLEDFSWCDDNRYGFNYNRAQGWDSNPTVGPSWGLIFLETEAGMESIGSNEWAFSWDGAHSAGTGPYFSGMSWWSSTCYGDTDGYAGGRRYVGIGFGRWWQCTQNTMDGMMHDDIAVIVD